MTCEMNKRKRAQWVQVAWWLVTLSSAVSAGISCLSNPCLHGICIDDINSTYSCYCVDGYTGVMCQTNWDECWSDPCQNGGTCIDGIAAYNCSCPEGFIGDNCEINYNECESNPCQNNGTCIDLTNGYMCACVPGFSGEHCEVDIAVCNSTEEIRCFNGGHCIEGPGFKFYCKCPPGWAGMKCEDQIDECESDPCQNGGVCIDVHDDYMCACAYGFTGKSCEIRIEFCDNNACSANALCVLEDGVRVCYCVPDYHGERCELQYDECALGLRCMNGGTCIDGVDNFTCSCPPKLTGSLCECLILEDGGYDCKYVSPTPLPGLTTKISTFMEGFLTTDIITTMLTLIQGFNDTMPRTKTDFPEEDTTGLPTTVETMNTESTGLEEKTIDDYSDTTTDQMDFNTETIILHETTEPATEMTFTTKVTPDIGDKKLETTTEFGEKTESTIKLPTTMELGTTAETITDDPFTLTTVSEYTTAVIEEPVTTDKDTTVLATTLKTDLFTVKIVDTTTERRFDTTYKTTLQTTSEIKFDTTTDTKFDTTSERTLETTSERKFNTTTEKKLDTTTERMFTDAPTERTTDVSISTMYSTTEAMEKTTGFDTTTLNITVVSYCSDHECNDHGKCISSLHGIRCQCAFNYAGIFCEQKVSISSAAFGGRSFVSHRIRNDTSISIEFNAKTLMNDGQIVFVDFAKGVYMQLYINGGLLKFKFSCGYQTMLLSELKTFVNKGYAMKIGIRLDLYLKEQHCNATLRLNDTLAMSGGQVAKIYSLAHNTTFHLGNCPMLKDEDNKPFIGCIKNLIVNGGKREVFDDATDGSEVTECVSLSCLSSPCINGGSCNDDGDSYSCSCTNGWMGHHCNQSVCDNNPCQSGGSCVRHPGTGFLCLCPYGKHGMFCEYNVDITRPSLAPISFGMSAFLVYPLSPLVMNSDRFDLRLRFQTNDMEQIALLAFVGQNGRHDQYSQHLALTFVKGYIMLTWNMGNGPRRVFTSRALTSRRGGHAVRVWRRGRRAGLSVDQRYNISGNAPARNERMMLLPYLYIGGHPSPEFSELPHDLPLHAGFSGCVLDVSGAAVAGRAAGGRGVGLCGVSQCAATACHAPHGVCLQTPASYGCICNEGWYGATCSALSSPCDSSTNRCKGRCVVTTKDPHCDCPYGKTGSDCNQDLIPTDVLMTGVRSYIEVNPQPMSSVSVALEMELKPGKERGLLAFVRTPHFYTTLSLQGGLLEYRWIDVISGLTSVIRSGVVVTMAEWHRVKAGRYGSRLYVWADGALLTQPMLTRTHPHTTHNVTVLLGGVRDLSTLPFDAMSGAPESYQGCIRNVHINNVFLPLEPNNVKEGQNVADCDGTACGAELCTGGTCTVTDGVVRCTCATGAGARCRRHAACSRDHCHAPHGLCRNGRCVCAAGYAGDSCQRKINVTIPAFDGEALVAPLRGAHGGRAGAQRLSQTPPSYVHLNFTTAHPNGLLLWIAMGMDYLGIGLENGFLKLASVLSAKSGHKEPTRNLTKLIPHAGYFADAEWHTIELRIERRNTTIVADNVLAYEEATSLKEDADQYDVEIFIGGITEKDCTIAKKLFPYNWRGCIDQISLSEQSHLNNFSDVYSENIHSCQLLP